MPVPDAHPVPELPGAWCAVTSFSEPDAGLLTAGERALFEQLPGPRRQREWFAGRLAARAALRAVGAGAASILRDERGAPVLEGPHAGHASVALTHGKGFAAAIAVGKDAPYPHVGIDWVDASDRARLARLDPRVLKPPERALVARDARTRLVCWGAREATTKATRTGMFAFGLSMVWLTEIDPALVRPVLNLSGTRVTVRWQPDGAALVMLGLDPASFKAAQAAVARQAGLETAPSSLRPK